MEIFLITFPGKTKKVYVGKAHDAEAEHAAMQASSRRGGNKKIDGALRYYAGHSRIIVLFKDVPAGITANSLEWMSMIHYKSFGVTGYNEIPTDIPNLTDCLTDQEFLKRWKHGFNGLEADVKQMKARPRGYNPKARERRLDKRNLDKK